MGRSAIPSSFNDTEFEALHRVYTELCADLSITLSEQDGARREILAKAIMDIATAGEDDPAVIRRRAMIQLENHGNTNRPA
ncbi:MAG: hypothetical protein J0H65_11205 [Rhizobiales bacterium]|nr:hypothetical protein [Hyphomicrobiales bacterium]